MSGIGGVNTLELKTRFTASLRAFRQRSWLVPIWGLLLVIVSSLSLYYGAGLAQDESATSTIEQVQWRLAWAVSGLALICALAWTIVASLLAINAALRTVDRTFRDSWLKIMWALAVVVVVAIAYLTFHPPGTSSTNHLIASIENDPAPHIRGILLAGNAVTAATIALLVVCCSSLVLPIEETTDVQRALNDRFHSYRSTLYSSSALLATGVVEMYVLQRWGGAYGGNVSAASASALALGAVCTLMLIMLFLPIALMLDRGLPCFPSRVGVPRTPTLEPSIKDNSLVSVRSVGAMFLPVFVSIATAMAKKAIGVP